MTLNKIIDKILTKILPFRGFVFSKLTYAAKDHIWLRAVVEKIKKKFDVNCIQPHIKRIDVTLATAVLYYPHQNSPFFWRF